MTRSRILGLSAITFLALVLAGCASTSSTVASEPMETKLGKYKTLIINTTAAVEQADTETAQLEGVLSAKLKRTGLFQNVHTDTTRKDGVMLNAKIVNLKKVSPTKRLMLGAFAGRGTMAVDVELVDAKTGKKLGSFLSEGKTSGGTAFAGTTEQAIEKVAEEIATFVKTNM